MKQYLFSKSPRNSQIVTLPTNNQSQLQSNSLHEMEALRYDTRNINQDVILGPNQDTGDNLL